MTSTRMATMKHELNKLTGTATLCGRRCPKTAIVVAIYRLVNYELLGQFTNPVNTPELYQFTDVTDCVTVTQ